MPDGLIAVCVDRREPRLKRLLIDDALFDHVSALFEEQETAFRDGCEEIPFSGTWRADADEIMTLPLPASAHILGEVLPGVSESSLEAVNARSIADDAIRALAVARAGKVLVQKYYDSQTVRPGRFLIPGPDGVSFSRTDSSALTFDRGLACVVEDGLLKFKSLTALARVIDTADIFREATAAEVDAFVEHPLIDVVDPAGFAPSLNQVTRKLIYAIQSEEMLAGRTIQSLERAAEQTNFPLDVVNGRVRLPSASAEIKALLQFLNDDFYRGVISGRSYVSNSKRRRR